MIHFYTRLDPKLLEEGGNGKSGLAWGSLSKDYAFCFQIESLGD